MNPGLLNLRVRFERKGTASDALGQPVESWAIVGRCRARGMKEQDHGEAVLADRETEQRGKVFRVRTQPFLGFYREDDRLVEEKRKDFPETVWKIDGWSEVPGTNGMYVDVATVVPEAR